MRWLTGLLALLLIVGPTTVAAEAVGPDEAAIQQVIQHANDEQVQAIAARDPSIMRDTSTSDHYQQLVRTNQDLLDSGVVKIELTKLDWGTATVSGSNATATTFETWRTSFVDGSTQLERDQNDYSLVKEAGTWKIASDRHPGGSPDVPNPRPSAPLVPPSQGTSRNWSGYETSSGNYTAVSGTWTVPQPEPDGSFGASAAWVGIGGVRSRDLIQAGTQELVAPSGRTRYQAWVETLPRASRPVALTINPGDSVTVSIEEQDTDTWRVAMVNNSNGETYEQTLPYVSSHSSAEWVEEAPSQGRASILPLDQFGALDFTAATTVRNGQTLSIAEAGAHPITMIDDNGRALAVPTSLGDDGTSFTIKRAGAAR
jgi:hypothetical protein